MKLRRLNDDGMFQFERFVDDLRSEVPASVPMSLLGDAETSEAIPLDIDFQPRDYPTRYELGAHLVEVLKSHDTQAVIGDRGFWSWIALLIFDQLCPAKQDGTRNAQMSYSYVMSNKWKHRPRHAVFTTWQLVAQYGEDSRFLLSKELPVRGELIEQLMARQYFFGCEGVIRLASRLYYDEERKTFKVGSAGRKSAGCVYRYVGWLQQLEVNYDLYSMREEHLLEILPAEFDRFRQQSKGLTDRWCKPAGSLPVMPGRAGGGGGRFSGSQACAEAWPRFNAQPPGKQALQADADCQVHHQEPCGIQHRDRCGY